MTKSLFSELLCAVVLCVLLITPAWSGQVVTEDIKAWAKQAISEEKQLEALKGQKTLAVLYFNNKTGQSKLNPLQKGLALMLITDLSSVKGIQVLERARIQALMQEIGIGASGLVDPGTEPKVSKLIGTEWLVGGDILKSLQVQSRLLDIPQNQIIGQPLAEGDVSELFRIEKDILFEIIKLLKIELTPEEETMLRKPCSTNYSALYEMFKGVEASDSEDYKKAAEQYKKAIKKDPNICVANGAFEELQTLGLLTEAKSKSDKMLQSLRKETSLTDQLSTTDIDKRISGSEINKTPVPVDIDVEFP